MRAVLVVLLFLPLAMGQIVTDPAGDVIMGSYGNNIPSPYPWQAVDMTAISVEEDEDFLYWTVSIAGEATNAGASCPDTGDLRTFFRYGEARYHVQQGLDLNCNPYAMLWETFNGDFSRRFLAQLDVNVEGADITATIPKELILDEGGAPPMEGRSITHVRGRSFNMASLGGPDINDPSQEGDMLVVNDNIPDNEADAGSYQWQTGGIRYEGETRLFSDRPFRASNGGDGVYVYDFVLQDNGQGGEYILSYNNRPEGWRIAGPTSLTVAPGESLAFSVAAEVPFRHIHGGQDLWTLRVDGVAGWAEIDTGISYLAVPQPAGHHPELYFYPSGGQGFLFFGDGGIIMNTTAPDSTQFSEGQQQDGPQGSVMEWHVCLDEDLKLGLNFTEEEGQFSGVFQNNFPTTGTFTGALYHVGAGIPLQGCHPQFFGSRTMTELATFSEETLDLAGGDTPVASAITPVVDVVPYEPGSTLYVHFQVAQSTPTTAQMGAMVIGGAMMELPLAEYREGTIVGAIGEAPAEENIEDFEPEAPVVEEAPVALPFIGLAAIALLARRRN